MRVTTPLPYVLTFFAPALAVLVSCTADAKDRESSKPAAAVVVDHEVKDIDGRSVSLKEYRGKAVLIVNVASECGYTPQYAELEQLYRQYRDRGLVVLGFPSNDFGGQEPGSSAEIKKFAQEQYGVTFPLFEKVHATGDEIAPVYKTLTTQGSLSGPVKSGPVKWNFTKFLLDPTGKVVARFPSDVPPTAPQLRAAIEAALPRA